MRNQAKDTTTEPPVLIREKLEAFDRLQPEFEESFQFIQQVHGQERFSSFPVALSVKYLHARWICECKSLLLSVARTVKEYEGATCLRLLRGWQDRDTASVVDFLYQKLDMLPLGDITRQLQDARHLPSNDELARRLEHGRRIMLNRGVHLLLALDAIFALDDDALLEEVKATCEQYRHLPRQIEEQLESMNSPLYSYAPHQALAQKNMLVMNKLGVRVLDRPEDTPGQRTERVEKPKEPLSPYAEEVIEGYQELLTPWHNNKKDDRFVDRPERSDAGEV